MSSLQRHALLKEQHELFFVSELLVELQNIFEVIGLNNHMLSAQSSHAEFFSSNTGEANSFPDLGHISFLGSIESSLILPELDIGLREFLVVADTLVQDLSSQVKLIVEAAVTTLLSIGLVRV